MGNLQELGVLVGRSIKFRNIIGQSSGFNRLIRPMCPTRWLCRYENLSRLLDQYPAILQVLEEMGNLNSSDAQYKARTLHQYFLRGKAYLAAKISHKLFGILEELNKTVQGRSMSVGGMLEAVKVVKKRLESLRSSEEFKVLYNETIIEVENNNLSPLKQPQSHNLPSRYSGEASPYTHDSAESYYRQLYFEVID